MRAQSPNSGTQGAYSVVFAVLALQILIGISTVLYQVPGQIAIVRSSRRSYCGC